ncbi:hypothetical protein [Pseudolysinimonas sp.]|uniref:hypothetical protein n=1 Tax=Pseudolysinimonas sp. TaxID=2680009 RepID=UPI003F7F967F
MMDDEQLDDYPAYKPGDRCRFGREPYTVVHADDCPDWPEGTVTDVRTGQVIRP